MVGPKAESTALVRHASRMFVAAASLRVPLFTVVFRKGYGLGAQAMAGGHFHAPFFTIAWPTGEFGGMGLEGAVRLGMRKELEAIEDPERREAFYQRRGRAPLRNRQGGEHGRASRDRRRHRSGRDARVDPPPPEAHALAASGPARQNAPRSDVCPGHRDQRPPYYREEP